MDKVKTVVVPAVVALVVAAVGVVYFAPEPTEVNIPDDQLGAIPGNSVEGKYFTIGGIEYAHVFSPMIATSSVACTFKNPFNATSTLTQFTASFTETLGTKVSLATSSAAIPHGTAASTATSTRMLVHEYPLASNTTDEFVWTPSTFAGIASTSQGQPLNRATMVLGVKSGNNAHGVSLHLINPKHYVTLKSSTGTPTATESFEGRCSGVFQKL